MYLVLIFQLYIEDMMDPTASQTLMTTHVTQRHLLNIDCETTGLK